MTNFYKIKTIINNDCTEYVFINNLIERKICDKFQIIFVFLTKIKKIKKYDKKMNEFIIYVIYFRIQIQNYVKNIIFMLITKLNQHDIIFEKF